MNKTYVGNLALCRRDDKRSPQSEHPCDPNEEKDFYYWQLDYNDGTTDLATDPDAKTPDNNTLPWSNGNAQSPQISIFVFKSVRPGKWDLYFMQERAKDVDHKTPDASDLHVNYTGINLEIEGQGGVYALMVTGDGDKNNVKTVYQIVPQNEISIVWQVPQIAVLTAAEILFSITGYEFAYSQSAPSMKALVQALWLLTTAAGDTIIVIITLLSLFDNMALELLFYAALLLVVIIVFALIAFFYYDYNYYTGAKDDDDDDVSGTDNSGFEQDGEEKPKL